MKLLKQWLCKHNYVIINKVQYSKQLFIWERYKFIANCAILQHEIEHYQCNKCNKFKKVTT